ncbi:hypothetical protein [Escherichia phage FL33]|uniref:Uncharacterized protein n=2 Tax=Tequatrovirus TaxID=10663 RepID=A0A7D5JM52_9CAUD|nr:hypothetical protein SP1_0042 [Escherichia phage vB_EcoM_SP1]UIU46980.1 hypothetical protein [Escherichia phage EP01]UTQ79553.1 hypothetical protein [Escherichia phage N2]WEU68006.1 hypothetical protein PLBFAGBN_00262 [Escherichia phage Killian]WPJ71412.1 hypothetical protein [Escherichia phage vB-Eco-KMB39]HCS4649561.1 hypothetical protein [Escherichia coli]
MNFNYYPILLEKDAKQPKWQGPQFIKGVYQLVVPKDKIYSSSYCTESACSIFGNSSPYWNFDIKLDRNIDIWLKAMDIGNITFDENNYHIIGRFSKRGKELYFTPEIERKFDAKPY